MRTRRRGRSRIGGDEYRRDVVARRDELLKHLYAAHARHLDIGYQAMGFSRSVRVEKFQGAAIGPGFIAAGAQQAFQGTSDGIVVIDNGNDCRSAHLSVLRHLIGS
ncbi:hypothetical protein D3C84_950220 [compost metagenome]